MTQEIVTPPQVGEEVRVGTTVVEPFTVFLTGLPASGKTTLARALEREFSRRKIASRVWDGDEVRKTVSKDLGFSRADRIENVRRMGTLAAHSPQPISIVAAVSPSDEARQAAMGVIDPLRRFVLVYVSTPLDVCEQRDPKGLYAKARSGEILQFTGVSDPYDPPTKPDVTIDTSIITLERSVHYVIANLLRNNLIK